MNIFIVIGVIAVATGNFAIAGWSAVAWFVTLFVPDSWF
jgi:hypothetical protein